MAVPILFWGGLVYGIYKSAASSDPAFLGSKTLTQCYGIVFVLFIIQLCHQIFQIPMLFGSIAGEFTLIALLLSSTIVYSKIREKSERKKAIQSDPTIKECKKCGSIVQKVYIRCPKCNSDI